MGDITVAQRLAGYGLGQKTAELPGDVVREVKRRLIDTFACMLGAYGAKASRAARAYAGRTGAMPRASVLGTDVKAAPDAAAFANGVMIRYLDYNDTYLSLEPAHPSDNFSAILAAAEAGGKGGPDIIRAAAAAYEVQCRLCDAASIRKHGWDHVSYGAFSATLAAGMLLDLNKEQMINALNIAGVMAPQMRQSRAGELSMWKGCAFASVARSALFASQLAKGGMTGPAPIFEGVFGFMKLVSGPFTLPEFGGESEGAKYKMLDTFIKYYPVEYHAQSGVGAAIELSKEIESADDIAAVTITTCTAAFDIIGSGAEKFRPATRESADHSLPYCIAAALLCGEVTRASFAEEKLKDSRLLALIDKIKVVTSSRYDGLYPDAVPNTVEIVLKPGRRISKESLYPKGHPKNPVTDIEIEEKFCALASGLMTGGEMRAVLDAVWKLEEVKDAGALMALFPRIRATDD